MDGAIDLLRFLGKEQSVVEPWRCTIADILHLSARRVCAVVMTSVREYFVNRISFLVLRYTMSGSMPLSSFPYTPSVVHFFKVRRSDYSWRIEHRFYEAAHPDTNKSDEYSQKPIPSR
jgi:hypothetical protein